MRSPGLVIAALATVRALLLLTAISIPIRAEPTATLRIMVDELPAFDPHADGNDASANLETALFEGLLTYHPRTLELLPGVAEAWHVSEDGRVFTFHLRSDAVYETGESVTASDFRTSWLSLLRSSSRIGPKLLAPVRGAVDFRSGVTNTPETVGITAISDRVLRIELERGNFHFIDALANRALVPIHPSRLDSSTRGIRRPVGNGPYRVERSTPASITLVRSSTYADSQAVRIARIVVSESEGRVYAANTYNAGAAEWVIGAFSEERVSDIASIRANPTFATRFLVFRVDREPWIDERTRQAFTLLLPLEALRLALPGFAGASTYLPPGIAGYPRVPGLEERDEREALRLLQLSGYPGGRGLPTIVIREESDDAGRKLLGLVESAWETTPGVRVIESGAAVRDGYSVALDTYRQETLDPIGFLEIFTSNHPKNPARYRNSEYDAIVTSAAETSGSERLEFCARAERMLLDSAVVVPCYHPPSLHLIDTGRIGGWYVNALDIHPVKYLSIRPARADPGIASVGDSMQAEAQTAR